MRSQTSARSTDGSGITRDDVRGHLVLCRAFMSRRWYTAAYERYEHVLGRDSVGAMSDPQTLPDLITIVAHGEDMMAIVLPILRRYYSGRFEDVLAEIRSQLGTVSGRSQTRRLESLFAQD